MYKALVDCKHLSQSPGSNGAFAFWKPLEDDLPLKCGLEENHVCWLWVMNSRSINLFAILYIALYSALIYCRYLSRPPWMWIIFWAVVYQEIVMDNGFPYLHIHFTEVSPRVHVLSCLPTFPSWFYACTRLPVIRFVSDPSVDDDCFSAFFLDLDTQPALACKTHSCPKIFTGFICSDPVWSCEFWF